MREMLPAPTAARFSYLPQLFEDVAANRTTFGLRGRT
jgi:hypothetical protein